MRGRPLSRVVYRLLLRRYPPAFRDRFGRDLEADFLQLLHAHGTFHAWRRVYSDFSSPRLAGAAAPKGEPLMRSLLFDVRYGIRALLKAPAFTAVTIATLALGIGANSAIFSLVNAVLVRPLEYHDAGRLMLVHEAIPESGVERFDVSPADYLDLVQYQQAFSTVGAYRTGTFELSGSGEPEQIDVTEVTASVFEVLGVDPSRGRRFLADEDQRQSNVVMISHRFWMRRFAGRDPLGSSIVLDRRPYTVVGVMPATFEFPKRGASSNAQPADVWLPLIFNPFESQARGMFYNHTAIGRLRDGVPAEQAARDLAALAPRIQENYPVTLRKAFTLTIGTRMLVEELSGQVRRPLLILLGAVGLVLLVACANVANLVLSRSVVRQREIGVRAALGASRLRLFQVLLAEAAILAICGGVLGLALGYWSIKAVPAVLAASLPAAGNVQIDWRVVAFTSVLALGSAVLFALVPLGAGLRRDLHDLLRENSTRSSGGRRQHRVQAALVVASVAMAFVLLVSAGLFLRSFQHLVGEASGVGAPNVLTMQVRLPFAGYGDPVRIRTFYRTLEEQLRAVPGVKSASVGTDLPLEPDGERRAFTAENATTPEAPQSVAVTWIHGDHFGTYGIPLLAGRAFSNDEQRENRRVAIVSKSVADVYWAGQDPIGKRLKWGISISTAPWLTVVGVSGDVVEGPPGSPPGAHIYVPYTDIPDAGLAAPLAGLWRRFVIAINADTDAVALTGTARARIAALDPALAITDVQTIAQLERDRSAPQRFSATVVSGFGLGALLLAAIGLYGVLAFSVSQRRREIGVRLALGADRRAVLRLIVRQGMVLVLAGLLLGCAGAAAATRLLRALLFETSAFDPVTFAVVPALLAGVAVIASYLPARRAANVDPMLALRVE